MTQPDPRSEPRLSRLRLLRWMRLLIGLGLLAWVLLATRAWVAFETLIAAPALLLAFVLQGLIGGAIEAQRLVLLVRSQNVRLTFVRSFQLVAMAVMFGYVVPGGVGGDLIKILQLGDAHRERRVELAAVVLVDRVTGMIALLCVACGAAVMFGSLGMAPAPLRVLVLTALVALLAIVGGLVAAWSLPVRRSGLYRLITRRMPLHGLMLRGLDAVWAFREHKAAIALAIGLSVLGDLALMASFVLAGHAIMPAAPVGLVSWVSLLALVANMLPLTPAGLGVGEAAFAGAFRLAGFAGGAQLMLAWRAGQLPLAVVGGLLYAVGVRAGRVDSPVEVPNG